MKSGLVGAIAASFCAVSLCLWVRGYFVIDTFNHHTAEPVAADRVFVDTAIISGDGCLGWSRQRVIYRGERKPQDYSFSYTEWRRDNHLSVLSWPRLTPAEKLGFGWLRSTTPTSRDWIIWVPHWLLVASGLAILLPWLRRLHADKRTMRRRLRGQCVSCGYDLRASSDICPECGSAVQSSPIVTETTP